MQTEQAISPDIWREAGWATVSVLVGMPARPAKPCRPSTRLGASSSPSRPGLTPLQQTWSGAPEGFRLCFEAQAVALLCGPLAEAKATACDHGKACLHDAAIIYGELVKSGRLNEPRARALVVRWSRQSVAVLANPATWSTVERVAARLTECGQLAADEVGELVRS